MDASIAPAQNLPPFLRMVCRAHQDLQTKSVCCLLLYYQRRACACSTLTCESIHFPLATQCTAVQHIHVSVLMQDCIQLTVACASSYERACLSHRALLRMSATRIEPLLLLNANKLQWLGWKSAPVITCSIWNACLSTHVASTAVGVDKPAPSVSMRCLCAG